ncbi:unnamed protein product [Rotaria sp. Silwood2]|nr:unnamed protein product [Rotaria sp. Silwood2]CAF4375249.1 unnamed protein product [Rotaria sp. Silwood2]
MCQTKLLLYNTYLAPQQDYDCLYSSKFEDRRYVLIPYCIRLNETELMDEQNFQLNPSHIRGVRYSFDELRRTNVTIDQLYKWDAPLDVIECYVTYNNEVNENAFFWNCTAPWFGRFCQYNYGFDSHYSDLKSILAERLKARLDIPVMGVLGITNEGTCYTGLPKCNIGGERCLDWREICNGQVDCLNGEDELNCWQMEINECRSDEFRCTNGACIPEEFFRDLSTECADQSDEIFDIRRLNFGNYRFMENYLQYQCKLF